MKPSERARLALTESNFVRITLRGGGVMCGRVCGCSNDRINLRTQSGRTHAIEIVDVAHVEQLREGSR